MSGRLASDAFEKLISPELYIRSSRGFHCRIDSFYENFPATRLDSFGGVGLAGSACRVESVKMAR